MIEKQDVPTLRRSSGGSQHPAKAGIWQALEEHGDGTNFMGCTFTSFFHTYINRLTRSTLRPAAWFESTACHQPYLAARRGKFILTGRKDGTPQRWPGARKEEDPGADITS